MKRLIVCSDGTWNNRARASDADVTNVVKVSRAVAPTARDGTPQVVFYDPGVGTDGSVLERMLGGATGAGLSKNVGDAYQFLVENFEDGDELYFFGFSRGAYTVRSTVGLIRKCGLLRKDEAHRFPEAYAFYRGPDHPDSDAAKAFRARHSRETSVHFLGVWDTVGALGIPLTGLRSVTARRYQFHDVALSKIVKHAYHAVSIDERRRAFEPALWSSKTGTGQTIEQVWFAGCHAGVGGGYRQAGLSDVALQWMIERASGAGLDFDHDTVARTVRPDPNGELVESDNGVWSLLRRGWRTIGSPDAQPQSIHPSALSRLAEASARYEPPNLLAYLEERGVSPKPATPDAARERTPMLSAR